MIPDLTESEYAILKAAIKRDGKIYQTVIQTADGEIADGRGRVRAATELQIDYPVQVIDGLDTEDVRLLRIKLNCNRRHLTTAQKRQVIHETLRVFHDLSNNYLAEIVGADDKTVAAVRREMEATAEIPTLTQFRGKDGKVRSRSVLATTAKEANDAAEALKEMGDKAPKRLLTVREATRRARRSRPKEDTATSLPVEDQGVEVHHCDFREMPVEDGTAGSSSRTPYTIASTSVSTMTSEPGQPVSYSQAEFSSSISGLAFCQRSCRNSGNT